MMRYKCIKAFYVDKYDDDGFPTDKKIKINVGSIWEQDNNGCEIATNDCIRLVLINGLKWIEITKDHLAEYFKQIKPLNDKALEPNKLFS